MNILSAAASTKRGVERHNRGCLRGGPAVARLSPSAVTARHAGIEATWARLLPAAQINCPLFFLTDPWEEENGRVRVVESLSEKKANGELHSLFIANVKDLSHQKV